MAIEAELADGRILEFPDGTDPAVIQSTVKRIMGVGSAPAAAPAPAQKPAPVQQAEPQTGYDFGAAMAADIAPAPAPRKSVLEGQEILVPAYEDPMLDPRFVAQVQAQLDALPADQRQAALEKLQSKGVYGRAAKVVAGRYAALDEGVSPTLKKATDRRLETQTERFAEQGLDPEASKNLARQQALEGRTRPDLQSMSPDVVGEQADKAAAEQAEAFRDAGFWKRVGGEAGSQMNKSGLGLLSAYADLTGDKQMSASLIDARRVETARGAAIPKGEGIFEKSAQGAMSSLAAQAPMMVVGVLTGTAAPVLAQAALQQFGDAYGEGRAAGLTGKQAATRAIPLATAEVFFERFGMTKALKGLRAHVDQYGANSVPAYVAKAIATEIPAEQATTITQYAIDAIPGLGLNRKPSMNDLYKQMEETFRQTVLQAGATAGVVTGVTKTAQGVNQLLDRDRPESYKQDQSYQGQAEEMMREKGFLTPEGKPGQQVEPPLAPPAETRIEPTLDETQLLASAAQEEASPTVETATAQKVSALAERIASRGVDPEDALRIATAQVDSDEQKKQAADEAAAQELPTYYPQEKGNRLKEIFLELVDQGIPPNKAQLMAGQQLAAEKEDRKIAAAQGRNIKKAKKNAVTQAPTTGAENVGQPIAEAGGVSSELVRQPDQIEPAGGAIEPTADGVVPAGQDVSEPVARKRVEPVAVANPESREAYAERMQKEKVAPIYEDTDGRVNRVADRYEQAGMLEKAAQVRESLQVKRPTYISTAELEVQQYQELAVPETPLTPAAEVTEKGKRGRKPLPVEQKAESDARRKQQRVDFNATSRSVGKIEADLAKAVEPINEAEMDTDEQLKTAQEEKRVNKNAAVRALYSLSKTNKGAPGKRATEALKNPVITPRELNDAAAAYELQKKLGGPSASRSSQGVPDPAFAKFKNGAQALTHIIKTSKNPIEKSFAERLRSIAADVEFMVIEEGDALPPMLQKPRNAETWARARGLFIQDGKKRYVFVRGTSFPSNDIGANNITVLHELLHAATNKKIELGMLASLRGFDADAKVTKFVGELSEQMNRASQFYGYLEGRGEVSRELRGLVRSTEDTDEETGEKDYSIFSLPHEFLAYGMSDPVFQNFLMNLPSNKKNVSEFSRFVTSILDLFNFGKDKFNALSDLINVTDKILSARKTSTMRLVEEGMPSESEPSASAALPPEDEEVKPGTLSKTAQPDLRTAKEVERDVDIAINQVIESRTAEELAKNTSALQLATDPKALAGAARRAYNSASYESKRILLNGATTDFLVEMGSVEIPELTNTYRYIQEMHGMTARLMEGANDPSTVLFNAVKSEPKMMQQLYDLALESTLAEIDPSTDRRSTKLNAKYDTLSKKAQNAYRTVRDYFTDMVSLYSALLDEQISELGASAEDKANLMSKLKAVYEIGSKIVPYFALVRRGNFWLRVDGKGKQRQFYMFRTMRERDKVADELASRRKSSVDELKDTNEFEIGNDIRSLRLDSYDNSAPTLTALMDAIDNMKLSGATAEGIAESKDKLKDAAYQLYLMSLPDQSFRKKFISREGITGFTTDLLQNFSDTASTMSVQLARIKYSRKVRNSLLAARKSIANRPDLLPYTEEMGTRVALELPVNYDESKLTKYTDAAANFGTRASFLYFLSGASSALLQPISIVQFALPLLGARHGYGATAIEMSKMMKVWNAYGISRKNSDGTTTFIMPTLRNSRAVLMDSVEKRAMDQMIGRNIGQITLAGELMARKNVPTEKVLSTKRRIAKDVWWGATSALMQTAERLSQEIVFLTSFRLSRRNAKAKFRKTKAYIGAKSVGQAMADFEETNFQSWINQATIDTHEALGNMTAENRPPIMRGSGGKLALQFRMFPLHSYIMLGKNAAKMIGLMPAKDRAEAAKTFWGQMGTTLVLAGAVGVPGLYTMIGFLSGMWRDEEELRPADLQELDWLTYFRQKSLPKQLGNDWARLVDRGVLNYTTGADFSSRLSLSFSNLFFREGKETKTEREFASEKAIELMGPSVNQALTYADAIDAFKKGDYRTGAEKLAPAFARNWMFMVKQKEEGAKDNRGVQLLSKDAISTGELIWRAVGFNSDALSDLQTNNFKVIGIEQKINNERDRILDRLDLHLRDRNMKEYRKAYEDMGKFNAKNPWVAIDDIAGSLEKRQEQRGQSWRGVAITEKNAPYAAEALSKSRADAMEKRKKSQREIKNPRCLSRG